MTDLPSTPRAALEAAAKVAESARLGGGRSSLEAFKATKKEIAAVIRAIPVAEPEPAEDAYMAACRALHWRTAQLCANYIEPVRVPDGAPQYPPDDFDFGIAIPTPDPLTAKLVEALQDSRRCVQAFLDMVNIIQRVQALPIPAILETAQHNCPIILQDIDAALAAAEGRG